MSDFLSKFRNSVLGATMADLPAMMTASGWRLNEKGDYVQDQQNDPHVKLLRDNLALIGETAMTAPTFIDDIHQTISILRHPIQTYNNSKLFLKDMYWFTKHPKAVKIYHGGKKGKFDIKEARIASESNIGLHVSPIRKVAESFAHDNVLEAYIPGHDMETIDIWDNDYRLLGNINEYNTNGKYFGNDPKRFELLKKYGGEPEMFQQDGEWYTRVHKNVNIPLRDETWPDMPKEIVEEADKLIKEATEADLKTNKGWFLSDEHKALSELFNTRAAKLFSDNGKKVIKYYNNNSSEGGGGISYMVTDPTVFFIPKISGLDAFNSTKSVGIPLIYGITNLNSE